MDPTDVPDAVRGYLGGPWGEHFARHDPARVLAECEAKRRIVADCRHIQEATSWGLLERHAEWTVRVLALPHADHPDYRDEWRP